MRVRYSFSSRHTGHARNPENVKKKKKKFERVLEEVTEESDIVLQVLDSRFFSETRNLEIENKLKKDGKVIIYVLNKSDLVNINKIEKSKLKEVEPYAFISCKERSGVKNLRNKIKIESKKLKKEKVLVGVIGYPNTGKSSVINMLIGKSSAGVGNMPGFTRGMQKIKLTQDILLIDSPGVIPQIEYSMEIQKKITQHTKVGSRHYSKVKNPEMIIAELMENYNETFEDFYKLKSLKKDSELFLEELGKKLHFLKKGGEVDIDRTARKVIKDWQEGKIKM